MLFGRLYVEGDPKFAERHLYIKKKRNPVPSYQIKNQLDPIYKIKAIWSCKQK
jgi:hypothetical protein